MLQSSNDGELIEEVFEMLHPEEAIENIDVSKLSTELRNKISRAMDDHRNGRFIAQDKMNQKMVQWLTT